MSSSTRGGTPPILPRAAAGLLPLALALAGLLAGVALGACFEYLHGNWTHLGWVTPDAANTVPYWVPQGLTPILISAAWTALVLRARSLPGWALLGGGVAGLQTLLYSVVVVPIALAGNRGVWVGVLAWPALMLLMIGCPVVAGFWPRVGRLSQVGLHVLSAVLFPICLVAGYSVIAGPFPH